MPELPDPTGISRRIPRSQRGVAQVDTSGMGRAFSEFGGDVTRLGGALAEKQDKQDRYDLAAAKSKWVVARTEAESALEGDKEYDTMEERYRDQLVKQFDDIGAGIRNAEIRDQFQMQQQDDLELGAIGIRSKAWGVEKDHHKGLLVDDLNSLRESALKSNSTETIEVMQDRIDAAAEMGYLSDTEAATMRQKSTVDYAVSRVELAPASEREEMLAGPLGQYVPEDVAVKLTENAKRERVENEAIVAVDMWMAQGLGLDAGMTEASKIKDPDVRKATEARFKTQYQVEQKATQDEQNNMYQDYASQVENGEVSYDAIPRADRDKMTAVQRGNLQSVAAQKGTGAEVKTDIAVYDHLTSLISQKEYGEARQYYLDNYSKLGLSDRKAYSKITNNALADSSEVDSFFTNKEYLKASAAEAGVDKKEITVLQQRLDTWYQEYQINNEGKTPTDVDVQGAVDQLLLRRPDTGWFTDDYMFEAETAPAELLLKNEPVNHVNVVDAAFKKQFGREPTPDELARHYFNNKRKGKFDGN